MRFRYVFVFLLLVALLVSIGDARTCTFCLNESGGGSGSNVSATVDVNATFTLEPGEPAEVLNIGNTTAALFDFFIPKGEKGDKGEAGANGENGGIPDISEYFALNGSFPMTGNMSMGMFYINNLTSGALGSDAVNKSYVDTYQSYNASYITSTYNATYDAKTNYNATYDGLIGKAGYTIFVQHIVSSYGSKNNYLYFGNQPLVGTTTIDIRKIYILKAGTITAADLVMYSGTTAGTAETINLSIMKNDAATLIGTLGVSAAERHFSNTGLNIPVVVGDYLEIRMGRPNWVTTPDGNTWAGNIYVST